MTVNFCSYFSGTVWFFNYSLKKDFLFAQFKCLIITTVYCCLELKAAYPLCNRKWVFIELWRKKKVLILKIFKELTVFFFSQSSLWSKNASWFCACGFLSLSYFLPVCSFLGDYYLQRQAGETQASVVGISLRVSTKIHISSFKWEGRKLPSNFCSFPLLKFLWKLCHLPCSTVTANPYSFTVVDGKIMFQALWDGVVFTLQVCVNVSCTPWINWLVITSSVCALGLSFTSCVVQILLHKTKSVLCFFV